MPAANVSPLPAVPKQPSLKLRLGAREPQASAHVESAPPPPKMKVKPKKSKAANMPPPADVDDGFNDLLQEVIAMEEMEQKKSTPTKPSSVKSSKPNKAVELDDDELLSLATEEVPPKHSDSESRAGSEKIVTEKAPAPSPGAPRRAPPASTKLKRHDKSSEQHTRPPAAPQQVATAKGKEKASPVGSPAPAAANRPPKHSATSPPKASVTPINEKKCREILKNLLKIPQAIIFSRPVDPELDGCPT